MGDSDLTLSQLQICISRIELRNGFQDETIEQKLIMLGEEFGELCKDFLDGKPLGKELADMQFLLGGIANRANEDLEIAFLDKFGEVDTQC